MAASPLTAIEEALSAILETITPIDETEEVELTQALGRVLAMPVCSSHDVPPFNNSAVDGYACRLEDLPANRRLPVSLRVPAGSTPQTLAPGTAARIFTGAPLPDGANAVAMQERSQVAGDDVIFPEHMDHWQNIRDRGQDIQNGQEILATGHALKPQDLGLLASIGIPRVKVYRRLKVALLSTGDELKNPGESLEPGQIYNSNRYLLTGLLQSIGLSIVDLGAVEDTFDATQSALARAGEEADLILTTGGVSVGEEDYIRAAIQSLGELHLWRLRIKPGKPLAYGRVGNTPLLGLPGNPSAVFVTFLVVAREVLRKMQGLQGGSITRRKYPADFSRREGLRREFLRVRLEEKDGESVLVLYPNQSSGVLMSASWASGLAVVPEDTSVSEGDLLEYYPLEELLSLSS